MAINFVPMPHDKERCLNCHLPAMDHYNGTCPESCDECGMMGSGQFMTASDHEKDCSRAKTPPRGTVQ